MAVPVDIYVKDSTPGALPIAGVLVQVVDNLTLSTVASGTTDAAGRAAFLLPGGLTPGLRYEVRFWKVGVLFSNPKAIEVIEPAPVPSNNVFDVQGVNTNMLEPSLNSAMCRLTLRLSKLDGSALVGRLVKLMSDVELADKSPEVISNGVTSIVGETSLELHTDSSGMVSAELPRGASVWVSFVGEEDEAFKILVPDAPAADITDLLHPIPSRLEWDSVVAPSNAISVQVGIETEVPFKVFFSDFTYKTDFLRNMLAFDVTDIGTVTARFDPYREGVLLITGVAPGSASITPEIFPPGIKPVRLPAPVLSSAPVLSVTVT